MTVTRAAVLRPGDWVPFDGGEYQVLALTGRSPPARDARNSNVSRSAAVTNCATPARSTLGNPDEMRRAARPNIDDSVRNRLCHQRAG